MIYTPREDSYLIKKHIKDYVSNKRVLDIGSGSGILAKTAIENKALSVLATDINEESIKLLKQKDIPCIKSNLFQEVKDKFDVIIFNPPYLPLDKREDSESQIATTGGKHGDEIILRFLKQSKSHLNKRGKILLLLSSLTPRDKIKLILKKLSYKSTLIDSENLFMEALELCEIREQ